MPNIEMKSPYRDLTRARETAVRLGGRLLWKDEQIDTYFETRRGKLKLRQSGLNGSELLPYLKTEQNGLKRSDYARLPVEEPALTERLLTDLLGQRTRVKKIREVYLIGNVRIHLDEVENLGNFLEFEAVFQGDDAETQRTEREKVRRLMEEFGVNPDELFDGSYPDLLEAAPR